MDKISTDSYSDVQVAFWGKLSKKGEVCGFAECVTLMMLKMGCFWRLHPDLPCKWLCLPIPAHATPLTRTHLQCFASTCLAWSFKLRGSVPVDLAIFFLTTGSLDRRKCKRFVKENVGLFKIKYTVLSLVGEIEQPASLVSGCDWWITFWMHRAPSGLS